MTRLVVSFLLLSVVTVAVVGVVAYLRARDELERSVFDRLEAAAELKADSLDRWVDEQRRNVVFVAGVLGGYQTGAGLSAVNDDLLALLGEAETAPGGDPSESVTGLLRYVVRQTADAQEFLVLDLDGTVVASTVAEREGTALGDEEFFRQGSSNTWVQPVAASSLDAQPTITIATPLFDAGGRRVGVLAGNLNIERLDRIVLQQTGLGESGETYLVSPDGRFVHVGLGQEYPDGVSSTGIEQALAMQDGQGLYENYRGEPVIGVYRWIEETDTALIAEMSQDEAFAPARRLALTIGLIGLGVVALLAGGIYWVSRRIATPILAITDTAAAVSAGDLTREAPVTTQDEVGTLAVAFNDMTAQLREHVEQLEHRVEERTAELSRQKQYFEALVDISPVAIVTLDRDERVTGWNPAATGLFGFSPDEAIGRDIDELVLRTEALRDEGVGVTHEALERGRAHRIARRTRKDGALVDVEMVMVPLVVDGEHAGFYVIYHDITELQRAREEAEAAAQAKSAFLAAMSHEIRTPMNAIIGMSGLLQGTELDDEQREFASIIRSSGESLLTIINDILDFSKIEAGRLELDPQPFDVRECAEAALDLVAIRASEKGIDLTCSIAPDVPPAVTADVTRVRQVMVNLLSNAVKFTDDGEVALSIALYAPADSDGRPDQVLQFSVRDTGIGIPENHRHRLFESFSQAEVSTTRRYGGTGLGLAISKRLSELMGGTIWVESELGMGSTFHFTIVAQPAEAPPQPHRAGIHASLAGKRVLIVDDNATNLEILRRQVESWGMLAETASAPSEALASIRGGTRFDVALLDLRMPKLDGLALAREIRRVRSGAELQLILLTSLGGTQETRGATEFAAQLTKPVKTSLLYAALLQVLGAEPAEALEPRATEAIARHLPGGPLRILVAEDNAVNQKLALLLLEKMGYRADVAGNGLEALEALERQPYDVVLMDVQMPELDGLEATRRIVERWRDGSRRPRLIAMTANAMLEDREACFEAGMDDYVAKPIRPDDLAAALARSRQAGSPQEPVT
jgi:PAS domain S-box-containing protein